MSLVANVSMRSEPKWKEESNNHLNEEEESAMNITTIGLAGSPGGFVRPSHALILR
jgi:hypothetical protein